MGTDNRYIGEAAAVAQVDTFTPTNIESGDIFTLTSVGWDGVTEVLAYTAVDTSAATVSGALIALWNASASTACTGVTASGSSTVILTANTAGVAFSVTATAVNGGATDDQTLDRVATTKNEGPSDYSSADNWSLGAIPVNTDDVHINGAFTILYGFSQSAVELDSFNESGAQIGTNPADGWRPVPLQVRAPVAAIGYHYGPSRVTQKVPVILDFGSGESCAIRVHNSGSNSTRPAVMITSKHASTTLEVKKGSVGLFNNSDGDAQMATVNLAYESNKASDADLFIEPGWTIATINKTGGDLLLQTLAGKTIATINIDGPGTFKTEGDGPITTINQKAGAGTSTLNSTGTITTVVIDGGISDFTQLPAALTVANLKLNGGTLKRGSALTITNWTTPDNPVTLTASAA